MRRLRRLAGGCYVQGCNGKGITSILDETPEVTFWGQDGQPRHLTPDEARALGQALLEEADYAEGVKRG